MLDYAKRRLQAIKILCVATVFSERAMETPMNLGFCFHGVTYSFPLIRKKGSLFFFFCKK